MKALLLPVLITSALTTAAWAQTDANPEVSSISASSVQARAGYAFADIADLADHAPLVVDATIKSASKVGKAFPSDGAVARQRFYVQADTNALIRGNQTMAKRISYLVDLPLDSRGKLPNLKKQRVLLFARAVSAKPDSLQLVAPDAQLKWDATAELWTRTVIAGLLNTNAPPRIVGVSSAFHASGNVTGAGETQIFLTTVTGAPVSLSISSTPGAAPVWSVTFGEVVGESAAMPRHDTLEWYRLACGLPTALPATAFDDGGTTHRAKIDADYAVVRSALGNCTRTRQAIKG